MSSPIRILLMGVSGMGKSTLLNALKADEEEEAGVAKRGEGGGKGCTIVCRKYTGKPIAGRDVDIVDTIGVGTTMENAGTAQLLAQLEGMGFEGDEYDIVIFTIDAKTTSMAQSDAVKDLLARGFLKGKSMKNVILCGTKAEPQSMEVDDSYDSFEQEIVPNFFAGEPGDTRTFAYTWREIIDGHRTMRTEQLLEAIQKVPNFADPENPEPISFTRLSPEDFKGFVGKVLGSNIDELTQQVLEEVTKKYEDMLQKLEDQRKRLAEKEKENEELRKNGDPVVSAQAAKFSADLDGHTLPQLMEILQGKIPEILAVTCPDLALGQPRAIVGRSSAKVNKKEVKYRVLSLKYPENFPWPKPKQAGAATAAGSSGGARPRAPPARPRAPPARARAPPKPPEPAPVTKPVWWHGIAPKADKDLSEALANGADVFEAEASGRTVLHEAIWQNWLPAVEAITAHAEHKGRLGELLHTACNRGETAAALINDRAKRDGSVAEHVRELLKKHPTPPRRPRRSVTPGSASEEGAPPTAKKRKGNEEAAVPVKVLNSKVWGRGHQYLCALEGGGEAWLRGTLLRESYSGVLAAYSPAAAAAAEEEEAPAAADPFAFPEEEAPSN